MDLLSSIRKEGSRGGVDFKWSDVSTSQHRENYLGHSLMAPVGRWQKNKDLNWYAKGDKDAGDSNDTAAERATRERKEEIRKIKEAEEDALAVALGLPPKDRGVTGANAVAVGDLKRIVKEVEDGDEAVEEVGKNGRRFGEFVGKMGVAGDEMLDGDGPEQGGLMGRDAVKRKERRERRDDEPAGSREHRDRKYRHRRDRAREGDERHRHRDGDERHRERRARSHSPDRDDRRHRSRSGERRRDRRDHREDRERRRSREPRSKTTRSPNSRDRERRR